MFKKLTALCIAFCMVACMIAVPAMAEDSVGDPTADLINGILREYFYPYNPYGGSDGYDAPVENSRLAEQHQILEDMRKEFEERFNKVFENQFLLMTKEEFLDKHFLGYGEKHPKIDDFIGNYIALSISSSIIRLETFLADGKPVKKSTHCGLSREEMEVPVITIEK